MRFLFVVLVIVLLSFNAHGEQTDIPNLVFFHDFENQTVTKFLDASGNGNHMSKVNGLVRTSTDQAHDLYSAVFTGEPAKRYGQIPANGWATGNSGRTFTAWVKDEGTRGAHNNNYGVFVNYGAGGSNDRAFGMGTNSNKLAMWDGGSSGHTSNRSMSEDNWYFVAIRYDEDRITYWANTPTQVKNIPNQNTSVSSMNVGASISRSPHPHYFKGKIDNLRFYNRSLTNREITKIFQECNDECSVNGQKFCDAGGFPQLCGNNDSDSCYEIIPQTVCTGETVCSAGTCVECINGETQSCYTGSAVDVRDNPSICRNGTQTCIGDAWGACGGAVTPLANETCNALDDTCNGEVDEGFGQDTCGIGACQRMVNVCEAGVPQTCVPGTPALEEICDDGIDNNCNGETDSKSEGCFSELGEVHIVVSPEPVRPGDQITISVSVTNSGTAIAPVGVQAGILGSNNDCLIQDGMGNNACTSNTTANLLPGETLVEFSGERIDAPKNTTAHFTEKTLSLQGANPPIDAPSIDTTGLAAGNYVVSANVTLDGVVRKKTIVLTIADEVNIEAAAIPEVHPLLMVGILFGALTILRRKKA
jgi:hypothetical protein